VLELAVDDVGPDLELAVLVRAEPGPGVDSVLRARDEKVSFVSLVVGLWREGAPR